MSRLQNLNSLRVSNIDVAFATAFGTLTSGAFLVGYMKTLNASDIWINLLSALPSLVGILQIPGGILGRSISSYKGFVAPGGAGWRLFYIPLAFLPLVAFGAQSKLAILTFCVAIASIFTTFVGPVYNDWIAALVPESSRGFYFARRNAIAAIVGAAVGIVGAFMLDAFRASKLELQGFTAVYVLGIVCSGISWLYFTKMSDLRRPNPIRQTLKQGLQAIKHPFADREFRYVLIFLGATTVGQTFAGNLFVAFARESLNLDYRVIQGTAVSMAIGNVVAAAAWGFLADRYGNKPLLAIAGVALALNPLPWVLCMPHRQTFDAILLLTAHFFMGITWCGINLCQFNIMLATAKPEDRANYIGAATTVTALVGGIAPLLGAVMMEAMRTSFSAMFSYQTVFVVTALFRLTSVLLLIPVKEIGSTGVRTTLRGLSGLSIGGVRVLRTLTRPTDMASRESAIQSAGARRVLLAADEIIKSLHDPLPQVRRRAAMALAQIDDPRAISELVHQLEDHPDLVDEETVNALATIGNEQALDPLSKLLDSPRPLLRRAAARAIGLIASRGDAEGSEAMDRAAANLVQIASDPSDPDLRRASLQALRRIGTKDAEAPMIEAVMDKHPSVRTAAAEAIEELQIKAAAPNLRRSLAAFEDEASAEVAYALGVVGNEQDIPSILREAARSVSMITRRRCLLGVARLLGVESDTYRLLLTDGMERDSAIQERFRPLRRKKRLTAALGRYSAGDEAGALDLLAELFPDPRLKVLAENPVEELFVVAALLVTECR